MGGIAWSTEDKKKITDKVHDLTVVYNYKLPYERGVLLALLREAQTILPGHKQRDITTSTAYRWVEEAVMDKMTKPTNKDEPAKDNIVASIPKEELLEKLHNSESVWELIKREVRKTPIIETLVVSIAEQIVDDIHTAVVARLLDRGIRVGESSVVEPPPVQKKKEPEQKIPVISIPSSQTIAREKKPKPVKVAPVVEVKKPKVILMGILDRQVAILQAEYGSKIDIESFETREKPNFEVCKSADLTLMLRKFLSHNHFERVTKVTSKWEYINGALTEIRARLDKLLLETV